jgi:hypothetical protein
MQLHTINRWKQCKINFTLSHRDANKLFAGHLRTRTVGRLRTDRVCEWGRRGWGWDGGVGVGMGRHGHGSGGGGRNGTTTQVSSSPLIGVGGRLGWRHGHGCTPVRDEATTSPLLTRVRGRGGVLLALRGEWRRWGGGLTGGGLPHLLSLSPFSFTSSLFLSPLCCHLRDLLG